MSFSYIVMKQTQNTSTGKYSKKLNLKSSYFSLQKPWQLLNMRVFCKWRRFSYTCDNFNEVLATGF